MEKAVLSSPCETWTEIEDNYLIWCDFNGIDISTKISYTAGLDQYGHQQKKRVLTDAEAKKLYKALPGKRSQRDAKR